MNTLKKPFLLLAGDDYYPCIGTGNWIKRFDTKREAFDYLEKTKIHKYKDWYKIVDLETFLIEENEK